MARLSAAMKMVTSLELQVKNLTAVVGAKDKEIAELKRGGSSEKHTLKKRSHGGEEG